MTTPHRTDDDTHQPESNDPNSMASRVANPLHVGNTGEFTYFDYAIWAAGCATVTIYETSSADQVDWIVGNSESVATICSAQAQVDTFNEMASQHETNKHLYCLDTGGMEALIELGKDISDEQVIARSNMAVGSDLATLVYTSGTTGRPKGCELTHSNFVWAVGQVGTSVPEILNKDASTLMFLPLAHIFSRLIQVISVSSGAKIAFSTGIPQLLEELQMVKPTWIFSVPRVLEKVYNGAAASAEDDGKGKIFGTTLGHHNSTMKTKEYLDLLANGIKWAVEK